MAPRPFEESQITVALAGIARVSGLETVELPLQQLVWDDQLSRWQPELVTDAIGAGMIVLYLFIVCFAVVVCIVVVWRMGFMAAHTTTSVLIAPRGAEFGSCIRVKIM